MNSIEKVARLLDSLMDASDQDLQELIGPVPLPIARGLLPTITLMIPEHAPDLDRQIVGFIGFLEQLVSDPEPVAVGTPE